MIIKTKVLFLVFVIALASNSHAAGPASIGSMSSAQDASGQSQLDRLRSSHIKDLALNEKAKKLYNNFENLALEVVQVPQRNMHDIWKTAHTVFKLNSNNADDAKEVVQWYTQVFLLTRQLSKQEQALDLLGEPEAGNKEKNSQIKNQKKRVKKERKKINKLKSKIQSNIKSILSYDKGDQQQALENWLLVSTGVLRDEREEKENKAMTDSLPTVKFAIPESPGEKATPQTAP